MPFGVEIVSGIIRTSGNGDEKHTGRLDYGVVGLIPKHNESFVWDNPKALRDSGKGEFLSITKLWNDFLKDQNAVASWTDSDGIDHTELTPRFIAEAIKQLVPLAESRKTIIPIDNSMSEFHQETLLKSFRNVGFINVELLWRPICLALDHLNTRGTDQYNEGDKLLIVDLDSFKPEFTVLELKKHEEGELIPLRSLPAVGKKKKKFKYSARQLKNAFTKLLCKGDKSLYQQLDAGASTKIYQEFLETGSSHEEMWVRDELEYSRFPLEKDWIKQIRDIDVDGAGFKDVIAKVRAIQKKVTSIKQIIWNGFPARLQKKKFLSADDILVNASAVSNGAADYGRRLEEGMPTYLDTLPGLDILSLNAKTNAFDFFPAINAGVVEGGKIERIPETITQFSLEKGRPKFTVVLHDLAEDIYKKSVTKLSHIDQNKNIPLLLSAEMKPANGHAKVIIEGRKGFEDVFGRQRTIELDWKKMKEIPNPVEEKSVYTGPEYYPVRGRIADDPDSLRIGREFATGRYNVGSTFDYPCGRVGYLRIHEPWGYKNPCGHIIEKEQRALFGALKEKDPEIQKLAKAIGKIVNDTVRNPGDRHKYLNYMFRYAPEQFREELRILYKAKQPTLYVNSVYAVGRIFYKKEDFEIFLDFFLKISKKVGYPEFPSDRFTPAYFWSFYRALCYYKNTSLVDRVKVDGVLDCICNYAAHCYQNGWPGGRRSNIIKYLLFGILFSLRLREHNHDFLTIDSPLYKCVVKVITKHTPQIPYPKAMMKEQLPGKLNDYVLRFVNDVQTKKDRKALHGLVVE